MRKKRPSGHKSNNELWIIVQHKTCICYSPLNLMGFLAWCSLTTKSILFKAVTSLILLEVWIWRKSFSWGKQRWIDSWWRTKVALDQLVIAFWFLSLAKCFLKLAWDDAYVSSVFWLTLYHLFYLIIQSVKHCPF